MFYIFGIFEKKKRERDLEIWRKSKNFEEDLKGSLNLKKIWRRFEEEKCERDLLDKNRKIGSY